MTIIVMVVAIITLILIIAILWKKLNTKKEIIEQLESEKVAEKTSLEFKINRTENAYQKKAEAVERMSNRIREHEKTIRRYDALLGESMPLNQTSQRKTGRTTRLVAYYIDLLFKAQSAKRPWVMIDKDDLDAPSNNFLISQIRNRLKNEHDVRLRTKFQDGKDFLTLKARSRTKETDQIIDNLNKKYHE